MVAITDVGAETKRIQFYIDRDGLESAIESSKLIYKVYRKSLFMSAKHGYHSTKNDKKPHHASFREFRPSFIESCLSFRKFLQLYGKSCIN